MMTLFKRVGEKSIVVPVPDDAVALIRKQNAVMQSWASRSIINASIRLNFPRVKLNGQ